MRKIALTSIIMVAMLFNACFAAYAGGEISYTVKPGDTLFGIGKKFGLHYRSIMVNNNLDSVTIFPGTKLSIPGCGSNVHIVKPGETLYHISRKYGTTVTALKSSNGLLTAFIRPGMKLMVPVNVVRYEAPVVKPVFSGRSLFSKEEIRLLARMIHAEARGEPLEGQIAVGAVIINRLVSDRFPGTIREIIFQRTNGVYQFTPVQNGQINLEPNRAAYYAAERAIKGEDPTGGALFFYNPQTSTDRWIKTLPVTKVIGNHVFAK